MSEGRARALFAGIVRLVPFSGVQALDIEMARAICNSVETHFVEELFESGGVPQKVLLPLDGRVPSTLDGGAQSVSGGAGPSAVTALDHHLHPLTGRIVDPGLILRLDGAATLAHFAGRWVPLPYLRFVGRDALGRPQFDPGPSNWVRAFIAPLAASGQPLPEWPIAEQPIKVTLAFDTSLEPRSRMDAATYAAPNIDDAAFGSTFICAETVKDVSPLLAERWLEVWLEAWLAQPLHDAAGSALGVPAGFQHVHIAHYLNLLRLLAASGAMPEARFTDTIQQRYPIRTTAMDLILDIGDAESTAVLVDATADPAGEAAVSGYAEVVRMRDLTVPHVIHESPFATSVEFVGAPFGDGALSRESGRLDAFHWPSLVRIGEEARRLSLRNNAAEGVTGLSNLRAFLLDDAPSPGVWRQSTDDGPAAGQGAQCPMVSGELLGLIGETGTVLGAAGTDPSHRAPADQCPAIRPRFSRASLMSFYVAELVLHALVQLNGAMRDARSTNDNEVRELRQVVVLAPPSLSDEEQSALLARVEGALMLVWRGQGWDKPAAAGVPKRPHAALAMGGDLSTQFAFLHNEVTAKYQGRFADLLRVYRGGDQAGAGETLRVASVDFAARGSGLMIVDYTPVDGTLPASEWHPAVQVSTRLPVGIDAALQSVIWTLVLPAIEAHLSAAGLEPARQFLDEITGRSSTSLLVEDPYFTRRLNRKVLWPAARGLFAIDAHGATSMGYGNRSVTLAALVALGGGRLDGVAEAFDGAALQAGARGFSLATAKLDLRRDAIGCAIRTEMHDCVEQIGRAVARYACDVMLLGGEGSRLPALRAEVLAVLPLAASRIIDLNEQINQAASDAMGPMAALTVAAHLPSLAIALDRRHLLDGSGLGGAALRQLSLAPPPAANPAQRAISGPSGAEAARPFAPGLTVPQPLATRGGALPAKGS